MKWPDFVSPRGRDTLDAIVEFAKAAVWDETQPGPKSVPTGPLHVAARDLVRAIGFEQRNEVSLLADLILKEVKNL